MENISISALSATCGEKTSDRSRRFALVRLTIDFFEENKERIGEGNLLELIHTLRRAVETECRAQERVVEESAEGLNVLLLYGQRDELDRRIGGWGGPFYQSIDSRGLPHDLSFSAGICEIGESYDAAAETQYARKAKFAMRFGRICSSPFTRYYSDADYQTLRRQRYLETQIAAAFRERQLLVYLQPQYGLSTQRIVGAEALVRWEHPKLGMLPPDQFIPLFEQDRYIIQLDFYVLEETCRLLRRWRSMNLPVLPVSVNFSKQHAVTGDFVRRFLEVVERYGVRPGELCLEWTENVFAESDIPVGKIAGQLRSRGFQIAMDDFGSGYSSLNMLTDLPVDVIKLDKQFLKFDRRDPRRPFLLKRMLQIACALHYTVLAEGVESVWQAELLRSLGYEYVQGFLFSRPVPAPAYERMLCAQAAGN